MFLKIVKWVFIGLTASMLGKMLIGMDLNKRVYNHRPGPCQIVEGPVQGSEDTELLPDGTAFISSGVVFGNAGEKGKGMGKIFMYDFNANQTKPKAQELKIESKTLDRKFFSPFGVESFTDKSGNIHLYVVNLNLGDVSIERFLYKKDAQTLVHQRTIKDPLFTVLNDLIVLDLDKFFVTNINRFSNDILRLVFEFVLQFKLGSIFYYDGNQAHLVDSWLPGPNGIVMTKDKKTAYVALSFDELMRVYAIQGEKLEKVEDVSLMTSPDNLFIDESGDIWIGAHPVMYKAVPHLQHPRDHTAPSQVLRLHKDKSEWTMKEIYSDEGKDLSASSGAVFYDGKVLIGTVHDRLMLCEVTV